ncbi:hypothetical protein [uncultured Bradyrhizobium sp.]|uniref:hypothetical protein n=1 Tax=uncultured Bradyrhizobium sp. TaxID=199684 RepID=UPI0035CB6433
MSFFNFRIGGRLYSGFGALVLIGALLAGFAVWQLGAIQVQIKNLNVQSENALRVTLLHADQAEALVPVLYIERRC